MNAVALISLLSPFVPVIDGLITQPSVAITNIMACRVYRQVKLGILLQYPTDAENTQLFTSVRFRAQSILTRLGDRSGEESCARGIELSGMHDT